MTHSRKCIGASIVSMFIFAVCVFSIQFAFAQTETDLYRTIIETVGIEDEALARELAQAAASAGITVSDIEENPLPPIPQQETSFTNQGVMDGAEDVAVGFNFLAVSIGVGVMIFLALLIALSRRFKHEKERIDTRRDVYESDDTETQPFVPSSRNLD